MADLASVMQPWLKEIEKIQRETDRKHDSYAERGCWHCRYDPSEDPEQLKAKIPILTKNLKNIGPHPNWLFPTNVNFEVEPLTVLWKVSEFWKKFSDRVHHCFQGLEVQYRLQKEDEQYDKSLDGFLFSLWNIYFIVVPPQGQDFFNWKKLENFIFIME